MGADWWLFKKAGELGVPTVRHYLWKKKETSFGYGQDWRQVQKETQIPIRNLVRRPTGGGIVYHGRDWTYCLAIPRGHSSFSISSLDLYEKLHMAMGDALQKQSIDTRLQPCSENIHSIIPKDCFREPVGRDLMSSGIDKKLAGAAMKKSKEGILIQGTMDIEGFNNFSSNLFMKEFLTNLAKILEENIVGRNWPEEFHQERNQISRKFSTIEWRRDRIRI